MRLLTAVVALTVALAAAPGFAQDPAAPPSAAPQAPPFPAGAKVGFIDVQQIIAESIDGKAASGRVQALNDKKVAELSEMNQSLQADQQKLQSGGTVLSASAADELRRQIDRKTKDIERATQDAQDELQELQQTLQLDFQRKLTPVIAEVSAEKGLHMVFAIGEAGLAWANPGLNITADVIKKFDAQQ